MKRFDSFFSAVILFYFNVSLLFFSSPILADQQIVEEPEDTVARIGDTVVLRCRVNEQKGQVIWMQGDIGLGYKRDLPFWERYRMVGSPNDGEFHLEIRNVSLVDEETYQCQLSSTDEEPMAKLSRRAKLTVIVEPQAPSLLGESIGHQQQKTQPIGATEGRAIRLSCRSSGGKPAAKLRWALAEDRQAQKVIGHIANWTETTNISTISQQHPIRVREHVHQLQRIGGVRTMYGNISEESVMDEETQLYTITSHLIFPPTMAEHTRWLVCLAGHPSYGSESRSTSVRLDVFYAPKVRVEVIPEGSQLHEGGYVRLHCASEARPDDVKLSWSWDGEPRRLEHVDSQTVLVNGLRFGDNGRRVTCTVENTIGVGTGVMELDVPYGPRFMSTNQTKIVERGAEARFQCEVLGNPSPIVRWYHGRDTEAQIFEGKNYTINNAQDWEEGEYRCTAEVEGFAPKTLHHMLFLKGPPKVRLADDFVVDGGSVTMTCKVQHRTERVKVHWYHKGRRVDMEPGIVQPEERRYQVWDDRVNRWELISRLTVVRFTDADFGTYNCSARNEYGIVSDARDIQQLGFLDKWRRKARELPQEAKIGAGAIALLLSLIAFCTFCCIRRSRRHRSGHSKFSNHSNSGPIDVKCEPVLDANTTSSTPLYSAQQQFYADQEYLCDSAQQFSTIPLQDPSIIQYPSPGYSPTKPGYSPEHQQQQYPGNGHVLCNGGQQQDFTSSSSYQSYNGAGSTFGHPIVNNAMFVQHPNQHSSMNSFGMAIEHPQQQYYQQHQQYCSGQLEPVTEVCTPESMIDGQPIVKQQPGTPAQRPFSRVSTHV